MPSMVVVVAGQSYDLSTYQGRTDYVFNTPLVRSSYVPPPVRYNTTKSSCLKI